MKNISKNNGLFVIALIAISVGATYAVTEHSALQSFGTPIPQSGAYMTGHVEAIVTDEGGNIIAYRQADNEITQVGLSLLAKQTFLDCSYTIAVPINPCQIDVNGDNNHTNSSIALPNGLAFGYMNIGNGSTAPNGADLELDCALVSASDCATGPPDYINRPLCGAEFDKVWTSSPELLGGLNSRLNVTVIATFDGADCSSRKIQEAGLWNNATNPAVTGGQMFARNSFGEVTLTTTDSLELTWRFTFTDI
jgi:hypothetical protein